MFRKKEKQKKIDDCRDTQCEFQVTFPDAKEGQDLRCAAVHTASC